MSEGESRSKEKAKVENGGGREGFIEKGNRPAQGRFPNSGTRALGQLLRTKI